MLKSLSSMKTMWRFAVLCCVHAVAHSNAPKQVVYTPWWPPGTEKSAESVGIFLPRVQTLYMTGMMEVNDTLGLEVGMELDDARDIAANVSFTPLTDSLVDCIVNVPPAAAAAGTAARAVRAAFEEKLGSADAVPALTVVGAAGEYTWANSSISCIARRGLSAKRVRRVPLGAGVGDAVAVGEATAVAVDADVWVAATVLWALVVAASRVVLGRHYVTDVLGGLLLGLAVTAATTQGHFAVEGFPITAAILGSARAQVLDLLQRFQFDVKQRQAAVERADIFHHASL